MALCLSALTHGVTVVGGGVAIIWILCNSSDSILRLIAGLVAIFSRDERPRAARALDVLNSVYSQAKKKK
jgi:hypothetical protein